MNPKWRLGAFIDQSFSNNAPSNYTVKNFQPLAGFFAGYAPTGTNLGPQIKVSAAYSRNGVNIARTTLANTEGGQGISTMTTQGAQLEAAYGFEANDNWTVSPFVGAKSTNVSRNRYTENLARRFPLLLIRSNNLLPLLSLALKSPGLSRHKSRSLPVLGSNTISAKLWATTQVPFITWEGLL